MTSDAQYEVSEQPELPRDQMRRRKQILNERLDAGENHAGEGSFLDHIGSVAEPGIRNHVRHGVWIKEPQQPGKRYRSADQRCETNEKIADFFEQAFGIPGVANETQSPRLNIWLEQFHLKDLVPKRFAQNRMTEFMDWRTKPSCPQDASPTESTGQPHLNQSLKEVNQQSKDNKWGDQYQQQPERLADDLPKPAQRFATGTDL